MITYADLAWKQYGPRLGMSGHSPPNSNPNADPYPWSQRRLTFTTPQPNPFPRYGAAVNAVSSKEGEVYLMGGLINGSMVKGDLWMIEAGGGNLACYPIGTTSEGPGPRVGHASLLVGNAFIVFGGDTKTDDGDMLDDNLYLLNTCMCQARRDVKFNVNVSQQHDNGRVLRPQVRNQQEDMGTLSTYWARRYTYLAVRSKAISSTIFLPLT